MTFDEITEKIIENRNNDIAKAFTMHIGSLLINNGIVPVMTEYTRNDVKSITDANEYKFVTKYGIAFNELDCSKHDNEIYNKAIDDFMERVDDDICNDCSKCGNGCILLELREIAEQLKAGGKNEVN